MIESESQSIVWPRFLQKRDGGTFVAIWHWLRQVDALWLLEEGLSPKPCRKTEEAITMDSGSKEKIYQRLEGSLDNIRNEMERVEIWASALHGFTTPVPHYQPDERYLLPVSSQSGGSGKILKQGDES